MSQIKLDDRLDERLDERLQRDCHLLGRIMSTRVLLHRNAGVAWFILVPDTDCIELVDLRADQQTELFDQINALSGFIRSHFAVEKLNVASIGNVVAQLHVHVIGRNHDDYCWPDPVWGRPCEDVYSAEEVDRVRELLTGALEDFIAE